MSTSPIPEVRDDDPEDVSWALSTAATQFARGDRVEALKWLRRAAEAASEAEKDSRALELAKAAADLTTPSMPPPSMRPLPANMPPLPPPSRPQPTPVAAPVITAPPPPASKPPPPAPPSTKKPLPPAPPSSRPAPASSRPAPLSSRPSPSKPPAPRPSTPAPRPAAGTPAKRPSIKPPKPTLDTRPRARTAPDEKTDTNIITEVTKLDKNKPIHPTEADAWPTESMGAQELDSLNHDNEVYGQERTRIGQPAYKPAEEPPAPPFRASQAVHVIIWRDADGQLRVAPRGTAVSAVTIEALLVAPSSEVDLLAWLSPS